MGEALGQVYVERACDVERECYLALLVDRSVGRVAFMASKAGGADIEDAAARAPDKILRVTIDPAKGLEGTQVARLGADLGFDGARVAANTRQQSSSPALCRPLTGSPSLASQCHQYLRLKTVVIKNPADVAYCN